MMKDTTKNLKTVGEWKKMLLTYITDTELIIRICRGKRGKKKSLNRQIKFNFTHDK